MLLVLITIVGCNAQPHAKDLVLGAEQLDLLLPQLQGKRVGLLVNNTATIGKTLLADTLVHRGVRVTRIFGPEHGFRGEAADGERVNDSVDVKTGIPLVSLYGKNYKPTPQQLSDIDILLFDIQDVGARFYTYISTLHYAMEACAENGKRVIVLDRPNPNGSYVDGPVRRPEWKSFVGMHPIPIVHGLTVGEFALMINGEGWLEGGRKCKVDIIRLKNWKHGDAYSLPVRPSPNLPNDQAVKLYPSLCLFEGTVISIGRGTPMPSVWWLLRYSHQARSSSGAASPAISQSRTAATERSSAKMTLPRRASPQLSASVSCSGLLACTHANAASIVG